MSLPGSGLISASCSAYRNTNGVAIPGVSAGSRNEVAIEASKAMVSWPSSWLWPLTPAPNIASTKKGIRAIATLRSRISTLTQRVEECLSGDDIRSLEPFGEPSVDGRQHFARPAGPSLPLMEPSKAGRARKLPPERALASGPVERLREAFLGFRGGGGGAAQEEELALLSQQLRDRPPRLCALRARERVFGDRQGLRNLPGAAETCGEFSK